MNPTVEKFLSKVSALHQLEPKNLPNDVLHVMVKMSPEELFKTCSQFATLRHNIPKNDKPITLSEIEIGTLAENYLKEILKRFQ